MANTITRVVAEIDDSTTGEAGLTFVVYGRVAGGPVEGRLTPGAALPPRFSALGFRDTTFPLTDLWTVLYLASTPDDEHTLAAIDCAYAHAVDIGAAGRRTADPEHNAVRLMCDANPLLRKRRVPRPIRYHLHPMFEWPGITRTWAESSSAHYAQPHCADA